MRKATYVLLAAFVLVILLIAGRFFLSDNSFILTNPYWDGTSTVAMSGKVMPVYSFEALQHASPGDTLLIIGPSVNFTGQDARYVSYFMLNGGKALVMDDYGTANTLLRNLSSPITIDPVPLCQDVDYYLSPSLPLIKGVAYDRITDNISVLALNHPVPLNLSQGSRPLANTSARAWLDPDDNSTIDGNETFNTYTVMAATDYGKGELVVAGDADLIINGMLEKGDNKVLLNNIMAGGTVYIDTGHGRQLPPLASLFYLIKYNGVAQVACAFFILIMASGYLVRSRFLKRKGEPQAEKTDAGGSLIAAMNARLPLSEKDLKKLNRKL